MRTRWIVSVLIVVLALLLASGALFLINPTWVVGGVCEVTVEDVRFVDKDGYASAEIRAIIPYGAELAFTIPTDSGGLYRWTDAWKDLPPRFLLWPRRVKSQHYVFSLATRLDREPIDGKIPAFHDRLLIGPGTYHLRIGEQLVCSRRPEPHGPMIEGKITLRSSR